MGNLPTTQARSNETNTDQFLAMVERISANPDIDADKIQKFLDMQIQVMDKQAEQVFNADMVLAQEEMPVVPKDKKNTQTNSWYSKYETILKHTKPIYTKHGFSVSFYEEDSPLDSNVRICADVMHRAGHTKRYHTDIPMDDKGIKGSINKTQTHAKGSSISYGRGYLMKMIFNIPTGDDDDGNAAGEATIEHINESQAADLEALIAEIGINKERLLKHLGRESIETIPADWYTKTVKLVESKRGEK